MFGPHSWIIYALLAAILWGYSYALSEKVLNTGMSSIFLMACTGSLCAILSLAALFYLGQFQQGFSLLTKNFTVFTDVLLIALSFVIGGWLIYSAISLKNATLVNFIEISYPFFTAVFAYFMFKEVQLNMATAIGGLMILGGVSLIFLKS